MKQTQRIISTYTGDTSGVCSALYELSGMVVMHDPSGCNSTYSTHDEPRWYDMDSLIFISGLTEKDAIFGNDEKIISDTVNAAKELKPRFIAIAGSPIPYVTGCDLSAVAMEIEARCGIPSFGFETDGMRSYVHGASKALAEYTRRMCTERKESDELSVNIIGVTPLDFSVNGCDKSMRKALENRNIRVNSVISMGCDYKDIENAGNAGVNLVVSSVGLECAKVLKEKFGIPYCIGTPYDEVFTDKICGNIREAFEKKVCFDRLSADGNSKVVIIGESVTSLSLANALSVEYGISAKVISAVDTPRELISDSCIRATYEDEIIPIISDAEYVIADPMYKPIVPEGAGFIALPHEAFSGRIYRKDIPNLADGIDVIAREILKGRQI
ncbi:MAG: oxidoreductase [Clostridia bacterium]|nr:oxidoreductase [Clostridia bacterium]